MTRRLSMLLPVFALLLILPACGKKAPAPGAPGDPGAGGPGADGPGGGEAASEYVLFAHADAQSLMAGELFASVKKAFVGDGAKEWDKLEGGAQTSLGVKPTDIASVTVVVAEMPEQGAPKFAGILKANKPIDKAAALKSIGSPGSAPDARGFYQGNGAPALLHFADEKTAVMVHPDLAEKYLAGFGKDGAGWPLSADLTKAAGGHTLFAQVNVEKIPAALRTGPEMQQFKPLLAAKTATLTLDLKGKALGLNLKAAFPDAAAAGEAQKFVTPFIGLAKMFVDGATTGNQAAELGAMLPVVKEAQKTLKDAKVEVAGADLSLTASYEANFDIGAVVVESMKKVTGASERMKASNNLKQIGLALHSFHDANNMMPIHATAAKGAPLQKPTDKPLLSWRVAILPYIEQENLYKQFKLDERWDSEHNKKLIPLMPKLYAPPPGKTAKDGHTHLQMVVGPKAMPARAMRLVDVTDGLSNTILVAEAADAVVWTKPDDIMLPGKELPKDLKKKFGGLFPGGFQVVFGDGSVRFIADTITDKALAALLTPAGGEVVGDN